MDIINLHECSTSVWILGYPFIKHDLTDPARIMLTVNEEALLSFGPSIDSYVMLYKIDLSWLHEEPINAPNPPPYSVHCDVANFLFCTWGSDGVEELIDGETLSDSECTALRSPGFYLFFEHEVVLSGGDLLADLMFNPVH